MPLPAEREIITGQPERLFYDGTCGLCHAAVRFVLARDRTGNAFRFAPLDSDLFRAAVPEAERAGLGETLVVQTADGAILTRARAVLHIMRRLGGVWRLLAGPLAIIPRPLLDRLYDVVAWSRHRLFRRPADVCPVLPPRLRQRFDL
jgi:predicted DCC family thiol-disulfide oxidoreductase YuxK